MGSPLVCRVDPNQPVCGKPQLASYRGLPGGIVVFMLRACDRKKCNLSVCGREGISKTGKVLGLHLVQFDQGDPLSCCLSADERFIRKDVESLNHIISFRADFSSPPRVDFFVAQLTRFLIQYSYSACETLILAKGFIAIFLLFTLMVNEM